jgi:hypothetical protein
MDPYTMYLLSEHRHRETVQRAEELRRSLPGGTRWGRRAPTSRQAPRPATLDL